MKKLLLFSWTFGLLLVGSAYAQLVTTFDYTGAVQTFTVPAGVTSIEVEAIGAQGGDAFGTTVGWGAGIMDRNGGRGGRVTCTLPVTPGETLEIYVGGQGDMTIGGFNGGGNPATCTGTEVIAAGGGGASDIRQGGSAIGDRVVVAGGGGGASGSASDSYASPDYSGAGGGLVGANAGTGGSGPCTPGQGGGTASGGTGGNNSCWCGGGDAAEAGSLGQGGNSVCAPSGLSTCSCSGTGCTTGGGGGGGYYGGGAGICFAGGGGGSSYTVGGATSVLHEQDFNEGNGQIIITILCTPMTITVSDDTVCVGDMVTLEATGVGTVTWDGGVTNGVAFTPPSGTTVYTATSSDGEDCPHEQTIFVGELPTVDAGTDVDVCEGEMVTLNAGGADSYSWDGGITDGVAFTPAGGTTTYTVTGTIDSTGCENTDMVDVNVTVIDLAVTMTGTDLVCDETGDAYQWIDCQNLTDIAGETSQSYTPAGDGNYACEITLNGCVDTTACLGVTASLDDFFTNSGVKIYPIPASENLTIELKEGSMMVEILSVSGEILDRRQIVAGQNNINVADFSAGVYVISFTHDGAVHTRPLIVK